MNNREQQTAEFEQWIADVRELESKGETFWDRPLGEGKWTVREMVSHIVEWDRYSYENAIAKLLAGEATTLVPEGNETFDSFNARAAEIGRARSAVELTADAIAWRKKLSEGFRALSDEEFSRTYLYSNGEKFQPAAYMRDFAQHDRHHLAQVSALENEIG